MSSYDMKSRYPPPPLYNDCLMTCLFSPVDWSETNFSLENDAHKEMISCPQDNNMISLRMQERKI